MPRILYAILLAICLLPFMAPAQTIINNYAAVTAFDGCNNKMTVDDASGFAAGDDVLLIQMKGATIDTTNTASFGTLTLINNCGNYEINKVASVSGNIITLNYALLRAYDIPWGKVQLVKIPRYNSYTVATRHTCAPWNGKKGGVFAIITNDTLTLNNDIDVSAKGFEAGYTPFLYTTLVYTLHQADYCYPQNLIDGAMKGEGISEVSTKRNYCRGPLYNGGGGGNSSNTGGGGGGNGGSGGIGGNEYGSGLALGGIGGQDFTYNGGSNKLFMAGGGGAGNINNDNQASGGAGGGIVVIIADKIMGNNDSIIANGDSALDCISVSVACNDGFGGGGAGGTILINANNVFSLRTTATGGSGGSMQTTSGVHGPGGGGGGGAILTNKLSLFSGLSFNRSGGIAGININGGSNYGAADGLAGDTSSAFVIPVAFASFTPGGFSATITDSIAACQQLKLKASSNATIVLAKWDFGDGNTSTGNPANHTYTNPGVYTVTLYATASAGCIDTFTKTVTVPPNNINETVSSSIINCYTILLNAAQSGSTPTKYKWYTGDGDSTTGNPANHTYKNNGTYTTTLIASDSLGCTDTVTASVAVNNTINYSVSDSALDCTNARLEANHISGNKAQLIIWMFSDGTVATQNPAYHKFKAPGGTYNVTLVLKDSIGCTDTIVYNMTLPRNTITVTASNDTTLCFNETLTLHASGARTYEWSPLNGIDDFTSANPKARPIESTTYYVVGTDSNGCKGIDSTRIRILPLPDVKITSEYDDVTCDRPELELTAKGANRYQWGPDDLFGSNNTGAYQTIKPLSFVKVYVYGYTNDGCFNVASKDIFDNKEARIFVPSAFSPNNDGHNDIIRPYMLCNFNFKNYKVYNRWGQEMYYTEDITRGWDGSYKSVSQDMGTYFYMVHGVSFTGKDVLFKGEFTLVK